MVVIKKKKKIIIIIINLRERHEERKCHAESTVIKSKGDNLSEEGNCKKYIKKVRRKKN